MKGRLPLVLVVLCVAGGPVLARRSLQAASTGSVIPVCALDAMVVSLQRASRSLLGGSAFPMGEAMNNPVFYSSSITGPQMVGEASQSTPAAAGARVGAVSDPVPTNSAYFQSSGEAAQDPGIDPSTSDPLIAMQNPGYLMADYQANHNIGATSQQTPEEAMAEYVGSAQGGADPAQPDLPNPQQPVPDLHAVLGHNFRELRSFEAKALDSNQAASQEVSWTEGRPTYPFGDPGAYPGNTPDMFGGSTDGGGANFAEESGDGDLFSDDDIKSWAHATYGPELAEHLMPIIVETFRELGAHQDPLREFVQQASGLDMEPDFALRKLLQVGTQVRVAEHQAAASEDPEPVGHWSADAQVRRFAAVNEPAPHNGVGGANTIFTDTAFLTDGGTKSFMPFAQPKEFAQRPSGTG